MRAFLVLLALSLPAAATITVTGASHDRQGYSDSSISVNANTASGNIAYVYTSTTTYSATLTVDVSSLDGACTVIDSKIDGGFVYGFHAECTGLTARTPNTFTVVYKTGGVQSTVANDAIAVAVISSGVTLDTTAVAHTTKGTSSSAMSLTSDSFASTVGAGVNQVIVSGAAKYAYSTAFTADTGFTLLTESEYKTISIQYLAVTGDRTGTVTATQATGSNTYFVMGVASFKENSAPPARRRIIMVN